MVATLDLKPHVESESFFLAARVRKANLFGLSDRLRIWLDQFLDNGILAFRGFQPVIEQVWTPEKARQELAMWRRVRKLYQRLQSKVQQQLTVDELDRKILLMSEHVLAAARMVEAVALLDQGPIAISQADFDLQDEVMRIAVLRTTPEYWEDPDRQAWLEADLTTA